MIETTIKQYLSDNLEGIPVVMERPKKPVRKYILLQLADAGRKNHIDAATFFITIIADNYHEAASLRDKVKDLLFNAVILPCISHADMGSESGSTDSSNYVYQYDLTFNFYYYREET